LHWAEIATIAKKCGDETGVTARLLPFTPAPGSVNLSDQALKNIEYPSQISLERDINDNQERSNENEILETEVNIEESTESK